MRDHQSIEEAPPNGPATALDKALILLNAVIADGGQSALSDIAAQLGLPLATAHRAVQTLEESGFLFRSRRGHFHAGPALSALVTRTDPATIAAQIARPVLARLAQQQDCLTHLGVLEQDMVTYCLKEGAHKDLLFTRADMQLEAYCSGLGKVLLGALTDEALAAYLAGGPFIALTAQTLVEPDALHAEIVRVREQGYALDRGEISEDLFCLALPITSPAGQVFAAISLSNSRAAIERTGVNKPLQALRAATATIARRMAGYWSVAG